MQVRKRSFEALTVAAGLLLVALNVHASLFEPVGDRQLVCESTDVVRGTITHVQAAWDDARTAIWTTATVRVDEVIRGTSTPGAELRVKEVGGTVGDYTIKAEGFPTFQQATETVLLLRPWEDEPGTYRVWGYGRGLFAVDRGPGGGEPTTRRYDVLESGQATLHTDRIPPVQVLGALTRQLSAFAKTCQQAGTE
jgi:hypothetical protein